MITKTRAVAAALTAAVALSAAAPAATAAGHGHGSAPHGHGAATKGGHSGNGGHHVPARVSHASRQLLHEIATLDARLVRVSRDTRTAGLGADDRAAILANVAADRAALADLRAAAAAADSTLDVRSVTRGLHSLHPEVYAQVLAALRRAASLRVTVAETGTALDAVTDRDVTAGRTAVDQADALLSSAVETALTARAASSASLLRGVRADLASASTALEAAQAVLDAGSTDTTDPTGDTTDPTDDTTDPTDDKTDPTDDTTGLMQG